MQTTQPCKHGKTEQCCSTPMRLHCSVTVLVVVPCQFWLFLIIHPDIAA